MDQKDKAMRTKVICLSKMDKDPCMNTSNLTTKEKKKLLNLMEEVFVLSDEDIERQFNEVCNDEIFDAQKDYSHYCVRP